MDNCNHLMACGTCYSVVRKLRARYNAAVKWHWDESSSGITMKDIEDNITALVEGASTKTLINKPPNSPTD